MDELKELIEAVDSRYNIVRKRIDFEEDNLLHYGGDMTIDEVDEILDDLTELERDRDYLDEVWVFLKNCEIKGITDEGRYNGYLNEFINNKI